MTEYIERDMLCRVLERYRKAPKNRYQRGVEDGMELALNAVKAIHTADVAPVVHGLWMPVYESEMTRMESRSCRTRPDWLIYLLCLQRGSCLRLQRQVCSVELLPTLRGEDGRK